MLLGAALCLPAWSVLLFALAVPLAVPADVTAALITGAGAEVGVVLWVTTRQQEIPPAMLSRISSYDIFGRFALAPIGTVIAGPLAVAYGTRAVLVAGGVLAVALTGATMFIPEVRHMRRRLAGPARQG